MQFKLETAKHDETIRFTGAISVQAMRKLRLDKLDVAMIDVPDGSPASEYLLALSHLFLRWEQQGSSEKEAKASGLHDPNSETSIINSETKSTTNEKATG